MRQLSLLLFCLTACGGDADTDPVADAAPMTPGFRVVSPDITIEPGQEITYCYYFRTPNVDDMVIAKWSSTMTPGSHHMIMFTTATDTMPPDTVSSSGCGGFSGGNVPSWTYAAQIPESSISLPTDDGNGLPLGQHIAAGTPAYFQMHYLNATDEPIQAHVQLDAEALAPNTEYTRTAAFVTYNSQINIPPGVTGDVESAACSPPADAKFWLMSTHAHKQAVKTAVKDGTAETFSSTDWEHPGAMLLTASPFYAFASGTLTYECTYDNIGSNASSTIVAGPSAEINEMCMATGYYFPATKPLLCLNNLGPF